MAVARCCVQLLTLILYLIRIADSEILTPPYLDLALGKKITATATCGDEGTEWYCELVGANVNHDQQVIRGQVCDYCDASIESKMHPAEYAVDGMETWWQSPPLSRGMKYNEVNLTIDLGQEFHVAYVFIRMGNSPRPGLWALEKSTDYGKTYKPWQYFSESPQDCERFFGKRSLQPITKDDSVICSTEYSQIVPLSGGEIPISLLNSRPSANKYFNSSVLQEWTRATNVRLRLLRTKNLLGHLMSVARQDPTVTQRYFYSIKDISIGGRCMCNGHADNCVHVDPKSDSNILVCSCQHNTCGPQCAQCCPGFEQKKWRISQQWDRFNCEPCNCHNHTTECIFDPEIDEQRLSLDIHGNYEGGGVCQNCQHNTEGINCNKCVARYYRPRGRKWGDIDVCKPCNCNPNLSTGNCEEETGRCECLPRFKSPDCDSCAYGYYDYPECKPCECNLNGTNGHYCTPFNGKCPCKDNFSGKRCEICSDGYYSPNCTSCECNPIGSVSSVCDKESGDCTCKSKYAGRTCDQCEPGYYNYPTCSKCDCDTTGTEPNVCDDVTGKCFCKKGFGNDRCDRCDAGYYFSQIGGGKRDCAPCNCSGKGSTSTSCSSDGKCNCLVNFGGQQCDQCSPGYYKYPDCFPCNCDQSGSRGSTCDDNGQCHCHPNFDGTKCDRCKEQFYNYPACEECNCDPRGVVASFAGCGSVSVPAGELCQCKDRVQGRICNDCKPLYWNLQDYNPLGCQECECTVANTLGSLAVCDTKTGQCKCKPFIGEQKCDECQDGFYFMQSKNFFGCVACDCDPGGSIDNSCNKVTGQCRCNSRVEGRRCNKPIPAHYFPTLHQYKYEVEEGQTSSGPVRYRSSEDVFPGYSWKGYVVFSSFQNEVVTVVQIIRSSLYRMVIKYASNLNEPILAGIIITPESTTESVQQFTVLLKPTASPELVTVAGDQGIVPAHLVMNPGNWTVTIKTNKEVLIDYFVLIPEAYYQAKDLVKYVYNPCKIGDTGICRDFVYLPINGSSQVTEVNTDIYFDDPQALGELGISEKIPMIGFDKTVTYTLHIEPRGPYVFLFDYYAPTNEVYDPDSIIDPENSNGTFNVKGIVTARFDFGTGREITVVINFNDCPYRTPCRQVVLNSFNKVFIGYVNSPDVKIYLEGEEDTLVAITSVKAIKENDWSIDYMTPHPYCLRRRGQCLPTKYPVTVVSKTINLNGTQDPEQDARKRGQFKVEFSVPQSTDLKEHTFIVQYILPSTSVQRAEVNVTIDGLVIPGEVILKFCPAGRQCRALVQSLDGKTTFLVNQNVTLTFKMKDTHFKNVIFENLLVVAGNDESLIREAYDFDYSDEFINNCAINHYHVSTNETGFCKDSVFAITSGYNSGTLSCFCSVEGSMDLECEQFGGQCKCKPNVIGRTCTICRAGYYGFPNCKPCDCPISAICNDDGECICPKNVVGKQCEKCKPYTFNFDQQWGCDDCNCNPLGVLNQNLQCDERVGNCDCKEHVIGRTCDRCEPGHYAFPDCLKCYCKSYGTTEDVCDQESSQCFCKKNVRGQACDVCKEEYFNLQNGNPDGCTKCYCFGKTTRCSSADLYWAQITGMGNWELVNIASGRSLSIYPHSQPPNFLNESVIGADLGSGADMSSSEKVVYFGAPNYYLGKRLTSYGGYLKFSILYTTFENGAAVAAPDVVIGGPNGYIVHNSIEQPPALVDWEHSVAITEEEFTHLDGTAVTRDQFMNTLNNITAIYIRATYWTKAVTTRLIDVSLDIGVEDWSNDTTEASSVEKCQCPSQYRGLSCEQCAEGHYRLSNGFCVPCQCHGHSNTCDVNTGLCLNCEDNTMGDHCEQCIPGYHGDANNGTHSDCLICACPIPLPGNNFAIGCELSQGGDLISCDCKPGYGGAMCEFCSAGYYGEPTKIGDTCKPCNCSGNIDIDEPGSCDSINGECLKCVNNTAGQACNLCAPGFYGDAVFSKNCTACICDEYGMDHCDPTTGTCVCRPGVVGAMCDQCAPNHWGLKSGRGCSACDCGLASLSETCDEHTGQCKCAKGVTGQQCKNCAAGYWNYTETGCIHCNCNTGYSIGFVCNATGQCQCLPGVIGEKCDRCPDRWVLNPQTGCKPCDACTDALLVSVEDMSALLANETQDFMGKADSFFTTQRLNYISNQTTTLKPKIAYLKNIDLESVTAAVEKVEKEAKAVLRTADFGAVDSENSVAQVQNLTAKAADLLSDVRLNTGKAKDAVAHVANLATGLELSQQPKVDSALVEARQIRNDIADTDLQPKLEQAHGVAANVSQHLEDVKLFIQPVYDQNKMFEGLTHSIKKIKDESTMQKYVDIAQKTTLNAEKVISNNRKSNYEQKGIDVIDQNQAATKEIYDSALRTTDAYRIHLIAKTNVTKLMPGQLEELKNVINLLTNKISMVDQDLPQLVDLELKAGRHANALTSRAESLRALAQQGNNTQTQHAYSAASAYSSIVNEIKDAEGLAEKAVDDIQKAILLKNDIDLGVNSTKTKSDELTGKAVEALKNTEENLRPKLDNAEKTIEDTKGLNKETTDALAVLDMELPNAKYAGGELQKYVENVTKANNTMFKSKEKIEPLKNDLANGKDFAQSLPKLADEAKKIVNSINAIDADMKRDINNLKDSLQSVKFKQDQLENEITNANEMMKKLADLVGQARTEANRVKAGVTFDSTSTLEPRLPDNIDEMSTSTHVSAYFKTKEKNGLILYLGNPRDTNLRRTKSDDFMVLEIQNGYPYLVIDIGDGAENGREPARIGSDKYVADDRWYQIIVDRVGRNVKLSIRESLENGSDQVHSKEVVLPGQHTIFNLDKKQSRLYVGGAPSNAISQLQSISYPAFVGQIEELMIGGTPVGLWNFVDAANLKGSKQRNQLQTQLSGSQEYRFDGRSHITVPGKQYHSNNQNSLVLYFKTYAPDGLIFLIGDENAFFSVLMQDGHIYLQSKLQGQDNLVIIGSKKTYNDGKWHKLDAFRSKTVFSLRINNNNEHYKAEAMPGASERIDNIDTMYFGGYSGHIKEIADNGFTGCLKEISSEDRSIDFNDAKVKWLGVQYGCQFSPLISLSGEDSFLRFVNISSDNLQLTLKFKTSKPDGLIFLYTNKVQTTNLQDKVSLSLIGGQLVLMSQKETMDSRQHTYNDSQWHVVMVTHNRHGLKLVVDDYDYFSTDSAPSPLNIVNGVLFIGGIQPGYVLAGVNGFSKEPFVGCISDFTLNYRVLNLLEPYTNNSVTFGRCGSTTSTGWMSPDQTQWPTTRQPDLFPLAPVTSPVIDERNPSSGETTTVQPITPERRPVEEKPRKPQATTKPRTTTKKPPKDNGCALTYDPEYTNGDPEVGYRFGTRNDSRIEYSSLPGRQHDGYSLTISFRTYDKHGGLMFYASAENSPSQFLALYMKDGQIHMAFNCGGETVRLNTDQTFTGLDWHTVTLVIWNNRGKLSVDNQLMGERTRECRAPAYLTAPFYYGGLRTLNKQILENLDNFYQPFKGCLKGLLMNEIPVTDIRHRVNSLQCSDNVEDGAYFGPSVNGKSNYMSLIENFSVGRSIKIIMEIKARQSTGLLLSIHGKNDFMVVELLENEVLVNVNNGKGHPYHASFKLSNQLSLCDGQWHTIEAIKVGRTVTVAVDNQYSDIGKNRVLIKSDLNGTLYIGGNPRIMKVNGVKSRRGFVGCIRNVVIRDNPVPFLLDKAHGNVHVGVCPKD